MPRANIDARTAIVTCMDPRIELSKVLGSQADNSFVLRNGGGRVTDDVLRSLILCTRLLNVSRIGILHHTDCRLQDYSNEELSFRTGISIDFLPFSTPTTSVPEDIARLHACGMFGGVEIWGGIYVVESHTLQPVASHGHNGQLPPVRPGAMIKKAKRPG
jgi:carbonic anhydrase